MSTEIVNYLIRSGISLAILILFYNYFLSGERTYKFNRFYLLFSMIFSFVVPLLTIPVNLSSSLPGGQAGISAFQDSYYQIRTISFQKHGPLSLNLFIPLAYFLVSALFFTRFVINLVRLKKCKSIYPFVFSGGYRIVLTEKKVLPFSFFSTVYLNRAEYERGNIPGELLSHEFAHIRQLHSVDIILVELFKIVFWFNPLLIFYKKAILLNHEYLADESVIRMNTNSAFYKGLLLKMAFRNSNSYLASSFNYSFTKKRLQMMTKKTLQWTAILKKIAAIPLFLFMGLLVINAQEAGRQVVVENPPPPPPPPPPPFGYNMWWAPLLKDQKINPDPSRSYYTQNFFETGDQCIIENSTVTLKGNVTVILKSTEDIYRILKSQLAVFDRENGTIEAEDGKIETYKKEAGGTKLIHTEKFKKSTFQLTGEDLIAPPPPPPPPKD